MRIFLKWILLSTLITYFLGVFKYVYGIAFYFMRDGVLACPGFIECSFSKAMFLSFLHEPLVLVFVTMGLYPLVPFFVLLIFGFGIEKLIRYFRGKAIEAGLQ